MIFTPVFQTHLPPAQGSASVIPAEWLCQSGVFEGPLREALSRKLRLMPEETKGTEKWKSSLRFCGNWGLKPPCIGTQISGSRVGGNLTSRSLQNVCIDVEATDFYLGFHCLAKGTVHSRFALNVCWTNRCTHGHLRVRRAFVFFSYWLHHLLIPSFLTCSFRKAICSGLIVPSWGIRVSCTWKLWLKAQSTVGPHTVQSSQIPSPALERRMPGVDRGQWCHSKWHLLHGNKTGGE